MRPETTNRGHAPGRPAAIRRTVGAICVLALIATLAVVGAPPFTASPAEAATESKLPKSEVTVRYQSEGKVDSGTVKMPDCGSWNIEGRRGSANWSITSSLGSGSKVFPGTEWVVTANLYTNNLDHSSWYYNDGPDPLNLHLIPSGPVERKSIAPKLPAGLGVYDVYWGDDEVGPRGPIQTWGYGFDSNSEPKLKGVNMQVSDGVDLQLKVTMRATAAGVVELPELKISGWDSTPKASSIGCAIPLDWQWEVLDMDKPVVTSESVNVDASYTSITEDDAAAGQHPIFVDVLKNDKDGNGNATAGNTDQVRISHHQMISDKGGSVSCQGGVVGLNDNPANFPQLATGPCMYTPPQNYSGPDRFAYTVRQNSTQAESNGVVNINLVGNSRPGTIEAVLYGTSGQDASYDLAPYSGDPKGEATTCRSDLVSDPSPGLGTVTMNSDCSFDWTSTSNQAATVTFGYRVCDSHTLLTHIGTNATKAAGYTWGLPPDLSDTTSRRCVDGVAKIVLGDGLILPPVGVTDTDVVDSGYSGEDIGAYSVAIPVLDNDFDHNGPKPTTMEILDGPDPSLGTAHVIGQLIFFTPADGVSGPVSFTYRVCEKPDLQTPSYDGFPFCGVGQVLLEVVPNHAPVLSDDEAGLFPGQVLDGFDLGLNDDELDGENLTCTTTPVGVNDPSKVESLSISEDCLVQLTPTADVEGTIEVTYETCDDHTLGHPAHPAPFYGADDRNPGDMASRCSTAVLRIHLLEYLVVDAPEVVPDVEPGPTDPDPEPEGDDSDPGGEDDDPTDPGDDGTGDPDGTGDGAGDPEGSGTGDGSGTGGAAAVNTSSGTGGGGTPEAAAAVSTTGTLPVTGSDTLKLVGFGLALLLGGIVLQQLAGGRGDRRADDR